MTYQPNSCTKLYWASDAAHGDTRNHDGTALEEDVAHIDILEGQVPEDIVVSGTVDQRQLYLHAVVISICEDAVL